MREARQRWDEGDTQRWLTWLARTMQRRGQTLFLLEEMQPTWLRSGADIFFDADLLLGLAIGLLVAPLAIVLPVHFGTGGEAGPVTWFTAIVTGGILGALTHGRSRKLTEERESVLRHVAAQERAPQYHGGEDPTDPAEAEVDEAPDETADPVDDESDPRDPTVGGTERVRGPAADRPKKPDDGCSWSSGCGCLHLLTWVPLLIGAVLYGINYLLSAQFAATVGIGNVLAVLFVAIAFTLYRLLERRHLMQTGRFIRPAETIGWSLDASVRAGLAAASIGLLLAYPAARFLDGWLGNRPDARIQFRGRAFAFEGQGGIGGHFLGLSDQGVGLALFIWLAIVVAGIALGGVRSRVVELKTRPNEGMRLSVRNALFCLWAVGLPAGVVLGAGLYVIPTVAGHVPFVRTSAAVPVEVLEARLRPEIERFVDSLPAWRARVIDEATARPRPDTLFAILRQSGGDPRAAIDLVGLMRSEAAIDAGTLARQAATVLQQAPRALANQNDPTLIRGLPGAVRALAADPRIAGTDERVAALFAQVPADSLQSGLRAARQSDADRAFGLGFVLGLAIGGMAALLNGGMAILRHGLLRLQLRKSGVAPLRYAEFLDYAADELGFLQRVGGGWMFIHRYLLEYFAERADA